MIYRFNVIFSKIGRLNEGNFWHASMVFPLALPPLLLDRVLGHSNAAGGGGGGGLSALLDGKVVCSSLATGLAGV